MTDGREDLFTFAIRTRADFRRADAAVDSALSAGRDKRDLRRRASLVIRCQDCAGQVVAHVTYEGDRPLVWVRRDRHGKSGSYSWLDGEFWGTYGWCKVREWVLDFGDIRPFLPPPGANCVTERLQHGDIVGAVR